MTVQTSIPSPEIAPARARALFHYPKVAFNRPIPKIAPHAFIEERDQALAAGAPTGFIPLDRGRAMDLSFPATLPTMMARYVVIRAGERLSHHFVSTGEVYCVLRGEGASTVAGDGVQWRAGDAFCLPGDGEVTHVAKTDAVLFQCTNEPELAYGRLTPADGAGFGIRPTLFDRRDVDAQLTAVHADPSDAAAGKAVILVTEGMKDRLCATPSLSITFNTLEAGGDQRAHRHSSAALTLCIDGEDVHSMVADERIDWSYGLVMLTPPCAPHSHHNRGRAMMFSFVVQDSPLHAQLRTTSFQFSD